MRSCSTVRASRTRWATSCSWSIRPPPTGTRSFTGRAPPESVQRVGFDGFHLDQYGYPKRADRPDGQVVDVAASFVSLIGAVREALPDAQLVFNNVNDFPTWAYRAAPRRTRSTSRCGSRPLTLGALAAVVARARSVAGGKPVVIAAYQHVYDSAPAAASRSGHRLHDGDPLLARRDPAAGR